MKQSKQFFKRSLVASGMLTMFTCAFLLTGCGKGYDADTNTIFVEEDGKIVSVDVESFDESGYSEKELKSFLMKTDIRFQT